MAQSLPVSTQLVRWPTTLHSPERCFKDVGLPCQVVSEGRVVVGSGREEPFPYSLKMICLPCSPLCSVNTDPQSLLYKSRILKALFGLVCLLYLLPKLSGCRTGAKLM